MEQVESLHAAWRGEALRKPFQPDERQKQILTAPSGGDIGVRADCARRSDPEVAGKLPSTYFTNPEVFRPHNEINPLFIR